MGWTTTSDYDRHHRGLFTIRDYLDREFASDNPDYNRFEVLDSSLHANKEYYAAIRSTHRESGKSVVFCLIALVSYRPSDPEGHTLGWKEMSENSGPFCYNCPDRILDLLDETEDAHALAWRQKCRDRRGQARAVRAVLKPGIVIRFKAPLCFDSGVERQEFTVEKHGRALRYRATDGVLCRIPKIESHPFDVVEPAA